MREIRTSSSMRGRRKRATAQRACALLYGWPPLGKFVLGGRMTEMAVVVQKAYDWNLWILPKVEKFPKSYRFSVGQSLVSTSLDLLMNLVDATYQAKNSGTLAAAVRNVNRVRYLVRLSKDLRLLNVGGYEFASQGLDEIGRMAGGWWKSAKANP